MQRLLILIIGLATISVMAQSTNPPPAATGHVAGATPSKPTLTNAPGAAITGTNTMGTAAQPRWWQIQVPSAGAETTFTLRQAKANELFSGRIVYSGIGVVAAKTRRPWQLLNPLAPPQYGSPEDNVARDPINGRVSGLKFLAIHF